MHCHRCLQTSSSLKPAHHFRGTAAVTRRRLRTAAAKVAVGIDLGTTSSAIALINEEGKPFILQDGAGKAMVPSVVTFTQLGEVLVGHAAQEAVADEKGKNGVDPSAHFYSIKRLMGCKYSAIQDLAGKLSYPVVEGPDGMAAIAAPQSSAQQGTDASLLMPQDISAHVLRHLLLRAEATLAAQKAPSSSSLSTSSQGGGSQHNGSSAGAVSIRRGEQFPPLKHIHEAVITVPAYFNPAQRAATIEAGKAAGLKRVSLLQEPVAAAMAYGYGSSLLNQDNPAAADKYDTLLVFDLGGGTFDVSVLEGFEGILEVLSTDGDAELGGDDYTRALAGLALHKARQQSGSSASSNSRGNKGNSSSRSDSIEDHDRSGSSSSSSGESTQGLEALRDESKESSSDSGSSITADEDIFTVSRSLLSTLTPAQRLAVLTAAEEAKQKLGGGSGGHESASIQLPPGSASLGSQGDRGQQASIKISVSSEEASRVWAPLMARLWRPLYRLATDTRTQFGGRLPAAASLSSPSFKESTDISQNSSSNKGSWEFHMFPPSSPPGNSAGGSQKYVAPPRRLTGLVLVGGSTRMPCIRDFIKEITGIQAASGVNPEEVVALGAALQAGVLVGSVGAGAELADGSYISGMHGRTTGITDTGAEAAPWQP